MKILFYCIFFLFNYANLIAQPADSKALQKDTTLKCCQSNLPKRFSQVNPQNKKTTPVKNNKAYTGMVFIKGGTFMMGGDNNQASPDEFPKHKVTLSSFWMDATEVTNKQFAQFVNATGYKTTAEQKVDWEALKKDLPPETAKPDESSLQPASLVFKKTDNPVSLDNPAQWWQWVTGANWKHPAGPGSNNTGKENYPVVQVSCDDAVAYCKWAGKRLPTEAEWEYAARGGLIDNIYPWGNENIDSGMVKANTWQGSFPDSNHLNDHFYYSSPVKSFPPNSYGLYDMAGNVWEWCADLYNNTYYSTVNFPDGVTNPQGPQKSFDPDEPYASKRVVRGGSFLCNESYCSGYRCSRRMKTTPDTGLQHTGFRCVKNK